MLNAHIGYQWTTIKGCVCVCGCVCAVTKATPLPRHVLQQSDEMIICCLHACGMYVDVCECMGFLNILFALQHKLDAQCVPLNAI